MKRIRMLAFALCVVLLALMLAACGEAVTLQSAQVDENGDLILTMSDGTTHNAGKVKDNKGDSAVDTENPQGMEFFPMADGSYAVWLLKAVFLEELVVPSTYQGKPVTQIVGQEDAMEFYDSTLKKITIPATVTKIVSSAFSGLESLESIAFEENSQLTSIGDRAFYNCDSLTSITIPASVTSIGDYAFSRCDSLTSITIPASVTSIGESAFKSCSSLESVTFGANSQLTSIGQAAFSECSSLTSVTFGENSRLTSIAEWAFSGCASLTSITIPASVTSISHSAFSDCTSLTSVTFENTTGWWVSTSHTATSGTSVDVSVPTDNDDLLKSTYVNSFWKRTVA